MSKTSFFLMVLLSFLLTSCGNNKELTKEEAKLVDIIADIHLVEASLQRTSSFVRDSMAEVYYDQLAEIHGMKRAVYEAKIEELNNHPKRLELVYIKVIEKLNKAEVTEQSKEKKEVD